MGAAYQRYQHRITLRGFCNAVGFPRHRLRYYLAQQAERAQDEKRTWEEQRQVKEVALEHPSYGYRRVYVELNKRFVMGKERVRDVTALLGLKRERPKKTRRPSPAVTPSCELPEGRKVQIDATRLSLGDGAAWVYIVQDVSSRACLAIKAVRSLSKTLAAEALQEARALLVALGLDDRLVVQSDAGSDFTSGHFQALCQQFGQWVRSKINQVGGMGILERLNNTFKHEYAFWHEIESLADLSALVPKFKDWYNLERLHSSVGYATPWQKLQEQATLA